MKRWLGRHWHWVTLAICWLVMVAGIGDACQKGILAWQLADRLDDLEAREAVSCPLAEQVDRLEIAVETMEATQIHFELDIRERMMQMSHSVGVGLIDVACLYRGHVLHTHDGHPAHEVRDKPVPGAWDPLSPLIEPPTRAECMQRFR